MQVRIDLTDEEILYLKAMARHSGKFKGDFYTLCMRKGIEAIHKEECAARVAEAKPRNWVKMYRERSDT